MFTRAQDKEGRQVAALASPARKNSADNYYTQVPDAGYVAFGLLSIKAQCTNSYMSMVCAALTPQCAA